MGAKQTSVELEQTNVRRARKRVGLKQIRATVLKQIHARVRQSFCWVRYEIPSRPERRRQSSGHPCCRAVPVKRVKLTTPSQEQLN
jgi:hypothetical protein